MKITLVQVNVSDYESPKARIDRVLGELDSVSQGSELVILPEHWITGAFNVVEDPSVGASLYDAFITTAAEICIKRNFRLISGSGLFLNSDNNYLNSSFLLDKNGLISEAAVKIHPFAVEYAQIVGSTKPKSIQIDSFKFSVAICYDLRFPEVFRSPDTFGSEVIIIVAAWPSSRIQTWLDLLKVRAIENQAFVIGVNCVGNQGGVVLGGHSIVLGPSGETIKILGKEEAIQQTNLNFSLIDLHRQMHTYLPDAKLLGF